MTDPDHMLALMSALNSGQTCDNATVAKAAEILEVNAEARVTGFVLCCFLTGRRYIVAGGSKIEIPNEDFHNLMHEPQRLKDTP